MLIKCPECKLQVSDKARSCPHCGYPMVPEDKQKRRPRQNRRKRLPNGFGQITEIKGKGLRKPFRAMVTVGKTEEGKPICKLLKPESYFETYNDAYAALIEYNRNPYDFANDITMAELYERWSEQHFKKFTSKGSIKNICCKWVYCKPIYDCKVKEIRVRHMKTMIEEAEVSDIVKARIKMLLNMLLDYAVEYEIIDHNYARDFKMGNRNTLSNPDAHHTFTQEEMDTIWKHAGDNLWIDMILIQCYSGWRPIELCQLRVEDIDLVSRSMIGGTKTDAGRNRKVPIHDKIYPIVEKYVNESASEYLFGELNYSKYRREFAAALSKIGITGHTAHDCRVRFVTDSKACGMDEYAIKLIVGHTIQDITEKVYTKRDFTWLTSEMKKLK